jgi:hypothetical protein
MLNWTQTLASQYGNSATMRSLLESMNDAIDPRADLDAFYVAWWNVNTAYGEGLDNWGRIVGVSRLLHIPNTEDVFGFVTGSIPEDWQPFNQGTFYTGESASQTYVLDDNTYRVLILTKALANITATTARGLNSLLRMLFPNRGRAYVIDNGSMSMTFVFGFTLTAAEYAILTESGVMPHPAGVAYNVLVIAGRFFGFQGSSRSTPFNVAPFFVRQ